MNPRSILFAIALFSCGLCIAFATGLTGSFQSNQQASVAGDTNPASTARVSECVSESLPIAIVSHETKAGLVVSAPQVSSFRNSIPSKADVLVVLKPKQIASSQLVASQKG